jgi:hypothetical protein
MSPLPDITSRDLTSRGLPGAMIFLQAGYLAGQSQPALAVGKGREHDAYCRAAGRAERKL